MDAVMETETATIDAMDADYGAAGYDAVDQGGTSESAAGVSESSHGLLGGLLEIDAGVGEMADAGRNMFLDTCADLGFGVMTTWDVLRGDTAAGREDLAGRDALQQGAREHVDELGDGFHIIAHGLGL